MIQPFEPPPPFEYTLADMVLKQSGFLGTGICFGIATVAMVTLRFVIIFENKRRDKVQGEAPAQHYEDRSINDLTDKENLNFRYLY